MKSISKTHVPETIRRKHVHNGTEMKSVCIKHVRKKNRNSAAVHSTPGYKVTGTILVLCPHHGLVCKNGVGDLQKGEK